MVYVSMGHAIDEFAQRYPQHRLEISKRPAPIANFVADGGPLPGAESQGYFAEVFSRSPHALFRVGPFQKEWEAAFAAEMRTISGLFGHDHRNWYWRDVVTGYLPSHVAEAGWRCVRVSDVQLPDSYPGDNFSIVLSNSSHSRITGTGTSWVEAFDEAVGAASS